MLDALFRPKSVAIIGASNKELSIGYRILKNLIDFKFKGPLYPVHPKEKHILDIPAYRSVKDIPGAVDLAHIVVRNTLVPQMMLECAEKGVKVVIINSAGFKEIGAEGKALEDEVVRIAKENKIRVFGPNCQGIMNTDPEVSVYANFTFTKIEPGNVSILAQSGGIGEVVNNRFSELGIKIRMYASNGNACDISIPEILEYWGQDDETKAIVLHIESLDNPAEFIEVVKKITLTKPILAMKTGRTEEGARAITSHTGAMIEKDTTTDIIFDKCGIVGFKNTDELCRAAIAFSEQPVPKGNRVGIITNTGGPAIIAADECIEAGLELPELSKKTKNSLKESQFAVASINNPVDILATAGPDEYEAAINALLEDDQIDVVLVNFITPFFVDCEEVAGRIAAISKTAEKPIIAVIMTNKSQWRKTLEIVKDAGIPVYSFPEDAAKVIGKMAEYGRYKNRVKDQITDFEINDDRIKEILQNACIERSRNTPKAKLDFLPQKDVFSILEAGGFSLAPYLSSQDISTTLKINLQEIINFASEVGYPVVLKIDREDIVHKSDAGGVTLGIENSDELKKVYQQYQYTFGKQANIIVQKEISGGTEMIVGSTFQPGLGHLVMVGMGGIYTEVLKDVSFGLVSVGHKKAKEMVEKTKAIKILDSVRGEKKKDIEALVGIVERVSHLVSKFPEIRELDLNPVMVLEESKGAVIVDARIKIQEQ